jgi:hypothetical protein
MLRFTMVLIGLVALVAACGGGSAEEPSGEVLSSGVDPAAREVSSVSEFEPTLELGKPDTCEGYERASGDHLRTLQYAYEETGGSNRPICVGIFEDEGQTTALVVLDNYYKGVVRTSYFYVWLEQSTRSPVDSGPIPTPPN